MTALAGAAGPVITLAGFGFRHVAAARPALEDVTLSIAAGEYVGVLGATGAGVSSLLAALNGVVPQLVRGSARGSVRVLGREPGHVPVREWARDVGLVFDDPELASTQSSVADEVAFGLENLGVAPPEMDARIEAALASVGLLGLEARAPSTLSGGELQRLAIACALATGPSVLVLDEPSANLDPAGRRAVYAVLRRLNRERGVTVLVADQDVEAIAKDATRVVVLAEGRVLADGDPDAVLGHPARLAAHGVRSTEAAALAEALGVPAPVPTAIDGVAGLLAPRSGGVPRSAEPGLGGAAPAVSLRDVSFRYPRMDRLAVSGVSLDVAPGEVVGIVGANGSGKSTVGRLVNGLVRPSAGRVTVDGLDTARHPVQVLAAHVGSVFQDPGHQLFAGTVADELALGPRALGRAEAAVAERVRAVAEALELDGLMDRHPLHLGRAQRKLVALGAVLAMEPRVLVLDEPTTGADRRLTDILESQARTAAEAGLAVLVASHDMAFLGRVAGRLVVLDGGRVVADAPTRDVFADASLMAVAGIEPPAVMRVALRAVGRGPMPWPPVTREEAAAVLARRGAEAPAPRGDGVA